MYFYDTETVGFHGMAVILQYAKDEGEIKIHDIWSEEIGKTLDLIEDMMETGVCGYNLAFDHFHLSKLYTAFELLPRTQRPESIVHDVYLAEEQGRFGKCLKPYEAVDLMMHVRKSKFQQGMRPPEFRINKVHASLTKDVVNYLNATTHVDPYLHQSEEPIWHAEIIKDKKGNWKDKDFRNVIGRLKPSTGLKSICANIFNLPTHSFQEVMPEFKPVELGYVPYAKGIVDMDGWPTNTPPEALKKDYCGTWPLYIQHYKLHWKRSLPRKYASDDVKWTRKLYHYFDDPSETVDSALCCAVASARWRGFDLDLDKLRDLKDGLEDEINREIIAPSKSQRYLMAAMDPFEQKRFMNDESMDGGTSAPVLEILSNWKEPCDDCLEAEREQCENCDEHIVAVRAKEIIKSRKLNAKQRMFKKLLLSSRLHPSYNVIGTKTSRMSGTGGLNPQGIDRSDEMRECFTLAGEGQFLMGGDFSGFELTIADAVYKDVAWHEMLLSGKKAHGVFGADLYGLTYEEVMSNKALYSKAKSALFLLLYGGTPEGMAYKLQIPLDRAKVAEAKFFQRYPEFLKRRTEILNDFRPLKDDFSWQEPLSYIESFFGHKRYYDLEWDICRILYNCDIKGNDVMCERTEGRRQTPANALKSALLGCIKKIQKKASGSAINHIIQSPGGDICKTIQKSIYDLQPMGISDWKVQTMNVHDEIVCVVHDQSYMPIVEKTVYNKINELKEKVPLISMDWGSGKTWCDIH